MSDAMERSASYSCRGGQVLDGNDRSTTPVPPWEQRNMARVPYLSRDAQPLNEAERQALQSLWAVSGEDEPTLTRPGYRGHSQRSFDKGYPLPYPDEQANDHVTMPDSAPSFTAPRPSPPLPTAMSRQSSRVSHATESRGHPPPTPPSENPSLSRSSTKSSSSTKKSISISSPEISPRLLVEILTPPLPGTMSARNSVMPSATKHNKPRSKRDEPDPKKEKTAEAMKPLGRRFKLAMKDIFKREPIDESQFERIDDRHWTDE